MIYAGSVWVPVSKNHLGMRLFRVCAFKEQRSNMLRTCRDATSVVSVPDMSVVIIVGLRFPPYRKEFAEPRCVAVSRAKSPSFR